MLSRRLELGVLDGVELFDPLLLAPRFGLSASGAADETTEM